MAPQATRIETHVGRALTPGEIFEITRARETSLSRLLMLYITTGLVFCFSRERSWGSGTCWRSAAIMLRIRSLPDGSSHGCL
jgi:hypothetical protein